MQSQQQIQTILTISAACYKGRLLDEDFDYTTANAAVVENKLEHWGETYIPQCAGELVFAPLDPDQTAMVWWEEWGEEDNHGHPKGYHRHYLYIYQPHVGWYLAFSHECEWEEDKEDQYCEYSSYNPS